MAFLCFTAVYATAQDTYKVGDEIKDFSLRNVDGKMVSLGDHPTAKGFIIVFTCNHCPFSQAYEQRIIDLDKKFDALGYPVVAINPNDPVKVPDDSFDEMVKRSNEYGYTFPYLVDETQEVAKKFGASRTPHVFVVRKDKKKFVLEYIGAIDNNTEDPAKADKKYVEDAVNALLASKSPDVKETKAIGCTIKWK
jgi:peroxiredoxin